MLYLHTNYLQDGLHECVVITNKLFMISSCLFADNIFLVLFYLKWESFEEYGKELKEYTNLLQHCVFLISLI